MSNLNLPIPDQKIILTNQPWNMAQKMVPLAICERRVHMLTARGTLALARFQSEPLRNDPPTLTCPAWRSYQSFLMKN